MHGVLHIAQDSENPLANKTVMSRSRAELLERTGSRYAPAAACDGLAEIEQAPAPCVFIGQPSEVTGAAKARKLKPVLDKNLGLTLSFFCAGSPSSKGTLELLRNKGIDPQQVEGLRYRGRGWPGMFSVTLKGETRPALEMTYNESWGFIQAFRPFSVHLCPDGSGEDADISCGDPWYRKVEPGETGSSLILVRTERGREILRAAVAARYLILEKVDTSKVIASQKNLIHKRGAIWGRIMALKMFGLPAPQLKGFGLFQNWLGLPLADKGKSLFGTMRRIITRKYYRRSSS
jgi:coenzyme F420 hydrogenase subunit beta